MRLIDADELMCRKYIIDWEGDVVGERYGISFSEIENAPTVDAVEVIRCKDCKYSSDNKVYGCRIESFNYDMNTRMYANDFCGKAERRTDG